MTNKERTKAYVNQSNRIHHQLAELKAEIERLKEEQKEYELGYTGTVRKSQRIRIEELEQQLKEKDEEFADLFESQSQFYGILKKYNINNVQELENVLTAKNVEEKIKSNTHQVCEKIRRAFSRVYRECNSQRQMWDKFFNELDQIEKGENNG